MEDKRAKDLMIPLDKYPHVPSWYTLLQVMEEMENCELEFNGRKSLPRVVLIFDLDSQLYGMVRRRDILRGLEPGFLTKKSLTHSKKLFEVQVDPYLTEFNADQVIKGFRDRAERPVSDVMLPVEVTVDYEDHIITVINDMVANDLSLIPVLKDNTVVGVVRSVDVFCEVTRRLLSDKPGQ